MKIVEQFNTLQGEGKYLGVPSYFIRTTGCNLRCAWRNIDGTITKCDTPYTSWSPDKGTNLNIEDTLKILSTLKTNHVVITGGEPTLQQDLSRIVVALQNEGYYVTIETNGTIFIPSIKNCTISLSPKLQSSYFQEENSTEKNIHKKNNEAIFNIDSSFHKWLQSDNDIQIKFVVNTDDDLISIIQIQKYFSIHSSLIWLMPQGISTKQFIDKQQYLFKICVEQGYNYSPRMHIDIFDNKRGV